MSYASALDYDVMSVLLKMVPRYAAQLGLSIVAISERKFANSKGETCRRIRE